MLIEIKTPVAGKGFFYPLGVVETKDEIAEMLIKAGHAVKKAKRQSAKKTPKE